MSATIGSFATKKKKKTKRTTGVEEQREDRHRVVYKRVKRKELGKAPSKALLVTRAMQIPTEDIGVDVVVGVVVGVGVGVVIVAWSR